MQKSREELKEIFVTGAKPQQRDYWDLFDSFLHKEELSRALARLEEISINPELAWQVDAELDEGSPQPVENRVVAAALRELAASIATTNGNVATAAQGLADAVAAIGTKASAADVATLREAYTAFVAATNTALGSKADASNVYSKTEADNLLGGKLDKNQGAANAGKVPKVNARGELELTDDIRKQLKNSQGCLVCAEYLNKYAPDAARDASPDDLLSRNASMKICCDNMARDPYEELKEALAASDQYVDQLTAWRMEGTLREFPKFAPKNLYFKYPIHEEDKVGVLKDLQTDIDMSSWQRGVKKGHERQSANAKAKATDKNAELINTFNAVNVDGKVSVQEIAEYLGVERRTIERRLQKCNELILENGQVKRK